MKSLLPALLCFVSLTAASFAADEFPLVEAKECRPRNGLPNFLAKANTPGAEVKIGYLGGSITAQSGWRPKTLAYFQKTYPQAKFSEINAAIGGTGSVASAAWPSPARVAPAGGDTLRVSVCAGSPASSGCGTASSSTSVTALMNRTRGNREKPS